MKTEKNQANNFKSIQIVYYALAIGQFLIACVMLYLVKDDEIKFSWEMDNIFHIIAPVLLIGCFAIGTFLYNKKLGEGKSLSGFLEKLVHYRETVIRRSSLLEGANLICIAFFFLEPNYFFLLLFVIGFVGFLMVRPSVETFKENYKLNEEERMELRKITSE